MTPRATRPGRLRRRGRGRLIGLVLVAAVVGTALGVVIAVLARPSADDTATTTATTTESIVGLRVQVLGAVLRPAQTPSGQRRRRARLSVRVRADNGGLHSVTPPRPRLIVAGVQVPTDPNADSPRTNFGPIAPSESAAVTLRFEVDGNTTTTLMEDRRARLWIGGRTHLVVLRVGGKALAGETAAP